MACRPLWSDTILCWLSPRALHFAAQSAEQFQGWLSASCHLTLYPHGHSVTLSLTGLLPAPSGPCCHAPQHHQVVDLMSGYIHVFQLELDRQAPCFLRCWSVTDPGRLDQEGQVTRARRSTSEDTAASYHCVQGIDASTLKAGRPLTEVNDLLRPPAGSETTG